MSRRHNAVFNLWRTFSREMSRCWSVDLDKMSNKEAGIIRRLLSQCNGTAEPIVRMCVCDWNSITDNGWYRSKLPSLLAAITIRDKLAGCLDTGVVSRQYGSRYYADYIYPNEAGNVQTSDDGGQTIQGNSKDNDGCSNWEKILELYTEPNSAPGAAGEHTKICQGDAGHDSEGGMCPDTRPTVERENVCGSSDSQGDNGERGISPVCIGGGTAGHDAGRVISGACLWSGRLPGRRRRFLR